MSLFNSDASASIISYFVESFSNLNHEVAQALLLQMQTAKSIDHFFIQLTQQPDSILFLQKDHTSTDTEKNEDEIVLLKKFTYRLDRLFGMWAILSSYNDKVKYAFGKAKYGMNQAKKRFLASLSDDMPTYEESHDACSLSEHIDYLTQQKARMTDIRSTLAMKRSQFESDCRQSYKEVQKIHHHLEAGFLSDMLMCFEQEASQWGKGFLDKGVFNREVIPTFKDKQDALKHQASQYLNVLDAKKAQMEAESVIQTETKRLQEIITAEKALQARLDDFEMALYRCQESKCFRRIAQLSESARQAINSMYHLSRSDRSKYLGENGCLKDRLHCDIKLVNDRFSEVNTQIETSKAQLNALYQDMISDIQHDQDKRYITTFLQPKIDILIDTSTALAKQSTSSTSILREKQIAIYQIDAILEMVSIVSIEAEDADKAQLIACLEGIITEQSNLSKIKLKAENKHWVDIVNYCQDANEKLQHHLNTISDQINLFYREVFEPYKQSVIDSDAFSALLKKQEKLRLLKHKGNQDQHLLHKINTLNTYLDDILNASNHEALKNAICHANELEDDLFDFRMPDGKDSILRPVAALGYLFFKGGGVYHCETEQRVNQLRSVFEKHRSQFFEENEGLLALLQANDGIKNVVMTNEAEKMSISKSITSTF